MNSDLQNLRKNWRNCIEGDGGHCPVCDRWGKVYARNINRTMAYSLLWLIGAKANESGWVDVPNTAPKLILRSNQLPSLRWWGLVERLESNDPSLKHSGMWAATAKGLEFAYQNIKVPHRIFTYKGEVEAFSEQQVLISECFEDNFDYQEVMKTLFTSSQRRLFD